MIKKINLNYIKKNLDSILIAFITLYLFFSICIPFLLNNSLDKFDTPGLLSLIWFESKYLFPNFSGWNPYFFAGFPQGILYPPLFYYLGAILSKFFGIILSYKLLISVVIILIPFSIYEFSLKVFVQKTWAIVNTLLIVILIVILPGYLGFNIPAAIDYGLGPSFLSIPIFFAFLSCLFSKNYNVLKLSIFFSMLILTHMLSAFVAGVIFFLYVILNNDKRQIITFVKFILISILLSAFWLFPFIYFSNFQATGYSMKISIYYPFITYITSILALILGISLNGKKHFLKKIKEYIISKSKLSSLIFTSLILSSMAIFDALINYQETRFSIPLVHIFRLQIYGILLAVTPLVYGLMTSHPLFIATASNLNILKFFKRNMHIFINISFLIVAFFAVVPIRIDPIGAEEVRLGRPKWDGRVMRAYKVSEVLTQSRAVIDKSIFKNQDGFAVDGLLRIKFFGAIFPISFQKLKSK